MHPLTQDIFSPDRDNADVVEVSFPSRVRASSPGVYLLFAHSSLRESLSCSLRLPPLPLHGYPCGLLPPYPATSIPLILLLHTTNWETESTVADVAGTDTARIEVQGLGMRTTY